MKELIGNLLDGKRGINGFRKRNKLRLRIWKKIKIKS